jgi:hypothetical protein
VNSDAAIKAPYLVIDDFMPPAVAQDMRAAVEAHLGSPYEHAPKTHLDWDYWYVPGLYTYLRTLPERVIGPELTATFHDRLFQWSAQTLGFGAAKAAYLSLYINGCRQGQHNDSTNGRFGFVYSLTKNMRRTSGGETLIWREEDYFKTRLHRPSAGSDFFQSIEPRFNRLVVFDDRMPHAVQLVEGNMDPLEGRIVIHGHIREGGPIVDGPLPPDLVLDVAGRLVGGYMSELGDGLPNYHGPAAVRFTVRTDGTVAGAHLILDRVRLLGRGGLPVQDMFAGLLGRISDLRFPENTEDTIVTLPLGFG